MNKPYFIMLVGLPGSGKSTYANMLATKNHMIVCSSDEIRKELSGDENRQDINNLVFTILHKRIKESLMNGMDTIYDATNMSSKRRIAFLNELKNIPCIKNV